MYVQPNMHLDYNNIKIQFGEHEEHEEHKYSCIYCCSSSPVRQSPARRALISHLWLFFCFVAGLGTQVVRNPLQRFAFPVDIEPTARFKSPTKSSVADFSKRAVSHVSAAVRSVRRPGAVAFAASFIYPRLRTSQPLSVRFAARSCVELTKHGATDAQQACSHAHRSLLALSPSFPLSLPPSRRADVRMSVGHVHGTIPHVHLLREQGRKSRRCRRSAQRRPAKELPHLRRPAESAKPQHQACSGRGRSGIYVGVLIEAWLALGLGLG